MTAFHYGSGEVVRTVSVEKRGGHFRVVVDDTVHEVVVRRAASGWIDLLVDGRALQAIVARDGERRVVKVGAADPVELVRSATRRVAGAAGPGQPRDAGLAAGMDGQVAAVLVRDGDIVEAGATLVVLEAMKMEVRLVAPRRGRVRRVSCRQGEIVARGRVLVELEAA